jgi:hypothetical protein
MEKQSKFDMTITFGAEEDKNCGFYVKHLRNMKKIKVEKIFSYSSPQQQYDALILPVPSSYGVFSFKSSILGQLTRLLGNDFLETVQDYIVRKYLGEQPVGSAFVLKSPCNIFKYIVVVALLRVATCKGDELSWLDPIYVPPDFAYTSFRGALLAVLRHNANVKNQSYSIASILCPDLFAIRKEWTGGDSLTDDDFDTVVQQIILATEGVLNPSRNPKTWAEGILLQRQILDKDKKQKREDLHHMLNSGTLEQRGVYSTEELETVIGWLKSHDNKTKLAAAKVIAYR